MPFDKSLLQECPVLQPSDEEFASPIEYLARDDVKTLGNKYGLLKIVPPQGWKPPFSLAQSFKFHTRTQNLGDLGLQNRSRKFFLENMNRFLMMSGLRQKKPWITTLQHPVHVYDLYLAFTELFPTVKSFSDLTSADAALLNEKFGIDSHSRGLINAYKENVWPYAQYLAGNGDNFDFPSMLTDDPESCVVCSRNHSPTTTLLCDNCDDAYHMKCLSSPLDTVPTGKWFCDKCLVGSGEYGFEENPELRYSLQEFVNDCQAFEQQFKERFAGISQLSIDNIEQIFWSIVETADLTIRVKYGADIHNQTIGEISGFPTSDFPPQMNRNETTEMYTSHPWNLTRLPFAKGSLLNHIKTRISGMTVPWLYVGSLLSTFCWHIEDHYTLSANYCHFGNIKNWYGIPSEYADKFEQHMRSLAPDLFQRQPDLLHQLVTLVSPSELVKIGIPVVYARQGPNEFIVTFPRVYHAGFNCGFNLNEAVNFSMDSWLPFGEKAVEDYKLIKKECVFDHYTLVENILKAFVSEGADSWKSRLDLIQSCLKSFRSFKDRQMKLVDQLKGERFLESHSGLEQEPITPKQEPVPVFESGTLESKVSISFNQPKSQGMKASVNENEDKLCDICRTYLAYQYCNINNKTHRFGRWSIGRPKKIECMLTPDASPYVNETREPSVELADRMAKTESNDKLQKASGTDVQRMNGTDIQRMNGTDIQRISGADIQKISGTDLQKINGADDIQGIIDLENKRPQMKTENELFNELITQAKRKLQDETSKSEPTKKRRSLRSSDAKDVKDSRSSASVVKNEAPAVTNQKTPFRSLLRELNQYDNIQLCFQCTIQECGEQAERVPRNSQIVFEKEFDEMNRIIDDAEDKFAKLAALYR